MCIRDSFPRRAIHGVLGGSDAWTVVMSPSMMPQMLSWMALARGPSRSAGGIADNLHGVVILVMVLTHHKHGGICRRDRDVDPLGFSLQVSPSLLHGGEDTSGLHNILSTSITPFDAGGISLLEDGDGLSIDDKLPILSLHCAFDLAMSRIILEHADM